MFLSFDLFVIVLFMFADHMLALSSASGECPSSFECGNLGKLSFPYTTPQRNHCGMLPIHGCEDEHRDAEKTVHFGKTTLQVTRISGPFIDQVVVRDKDLEDRLEKGVCDALSCNITPPPTSPFGSLYIQTITMYKCNSSHNYNLSEQFLNYTGCAKSHRETIFFQSQNLDHPPPSLETCPWVMVPVNMLAFSANPFTFIASKFSVFIQLSRDCSACVFNNGSCRLNNTGGFYCSKYIVNSHEIGAKDQNKRLAWKMEITIGFGLGLGILILALLLCFGLYKQKQSTPSHVRLESTNQYRNNDADPDGGRLFFGVPIFSYMELQDATNNFDPSNKLGDGGFGSVYYGKLQDGREVAVKHLFNHNYKRVEQFMTEVEILTRLRHTNLVSLFGCTSRQSSELLLVYEYITNGTLASHLHAGSANPMSLTWPMRIKIAIETATALAYLHASGIIHRDVKTNNILLDNNFCVKVADFGLSRLFPDDVSHVSTAPQGTPGYLDPEYHYCFRLTHKSDVYSFGVVLMELISSMPAVDMRRNKEEITLANLALRKIQKNELEELVDPCLGIDKDSEVKKKVVALGELAFQCLQIDKEMRPSIDEVLEVLRKIESGKEEEGEDLEEEGEGTVKTSISYYEGKLFKSASSPTDMTNKKWRNGEVDEGKLFSI